jgi:8-oxo-dGTP diphosphatase
VDPGETFDRALIREVAEETGLAVSIQHVAGAIEFEMPKLQVAQLIMDGSVESGQVQLSNEHEAFLWVKPEKLATLDLVDWFEPFAKKLAKKVLKSKLGDATKRLE